ncbi:transcriptional regulator, GntR family [Kribbella flavida DSM 17836]|uniref:Transcriptional regulator, GntR family n=1 Tax=Kribbella flavida (strain DSM 17836 / JCM 10339 / NBRC 14399) TaxID=479435 RepID=D2PQE2_KRIFD|nr:GntR family transcriptional regulator [Kribbella flavida]ADB34844.1 transcriptional regulator, GntR family [Kribbella flavida DSM 17836]
MPAPYQRIAATIRHRISTGDLRQGDRVPSTRELMRAYGVAMATATKALTTLQQEGLVHSRPGVGTVVGPPRRTPARTSEVVSVLSREDVVRTAITLADTEGLAALSMRRIAGELGVSTMGLYRHVGGKDALVLQMVDTAIGDFPLPPGPPAGWREGIETAARLQWAAYRRHLWLPGAITVGRPQLVPNLLSHGDAVLRSLTDLEPSKALYVSISVFGYVRGVALNLESEALAEQDTGLTADEWADEQVDRLAALTGELPGFKALGVPEGFAFDFDLDTLFESGLELLLDGLAVQLERARTPLR